MQDSHPLLLCVHNRHLKINQDPAAKEIHQHSNKLILKLQHFSCNFVLTNREVSIHTYLGRLELKPLFLKNYDLYRIYQFIV